MTGFAVNLLIVVLLLVLLQYILDAVKLEAKARAIVWVVAVVVGVAWLLIGLR